ncbi:DUF1127 domain-containing protein [Inquilinus limosus]|uniref:DUF1127 domain-containing protein n=1 Tax=Inquilinus limosus TaxID=171674 RepID=A0A211ZRG6_9PROT|nr:DUF1127 domain-containing protein [Inquilinus limosus]OWJ67829.1 hypothetical protein BWR60_07575 [Inquilinus limosus]
MRNFVSTPRGPWDDLAGPAANDNIQGGPVPRPRLAVAALPSVALRLMLVLEDAWEKARQRRDLAGLSELDLKDLGWTRSDAAAELAKPFWR